jgi:hypothetical protein
MKKFKFLLIAILFAFIGCESLDEVPMSSLSPSNYYTNSAQVESAYAAAMQSLWSYWGVYGSGMSGGTWFSNDDQSLWGELDLDVYSGESYWFGHYEAITNVNAALDAVMNGQTKGTQEELDLLEGQGRFIRAYNYFMLVRLFGPVPIYTEGENAATVPEVRASISEVYTVILNDLQIASNKLPESWPESQRGRPGKWAAMGMLAKVYLTMATAPLKQASNYSLAAAEAKKVMESGITLIPEIEEVFSFKNRYSPEWMFGFNSTNDDKSTPVDVYAPSESPWDGWADVAACDTFAKFFPDQPRKYAYLQCYNGDSAYYTEWEGWNPRPGIRKYMYADIEDIWAYHTWYNFPVLRYADVLLIYAEAANQASGGPTQEAVDALNQVIDRANGNTDGIPVSRATTAMSMQEFDDKVILERSWELCFEYDRWFDLVRKEILLESLEASKPLAAVNYDDRFYLLPVPLVDLRLNPLLTQNPGWPESE